MHPVFRTNRKNYVPTAAYLYRDGHVVVRFSKLGSSSDEFVQLAESVGFESVSFDSRSIGADVPQATMRVVFHQPMLLAAMAMLPKPHIEACPAHVDNGSANSQKLGVSVGYVSVHSGWRYGNGFTTHDLTNMLSGPAYVQTDFLGRPITEEKWDEVKDLTDYDGSPIAAKFLKRAPK